MKPAAAVLLTLAWPSCVAHAQERLTFAQADCVPSYPAEARRANQEGAVDLRYRVGKDGSVTDAQVEISSGFVSLDEAAREAVMRCRFTAAPLDGKVRGRWQPVAFTFKLAQGGTQPAHQACKPKYPPEALRANEQGTVRQRFLVGEDGTVRDSWLAGTSGFESLDEAVRRASSGCRFQPAMIDGKPRQRWTEMDFVFQITFSDFPRVQRFRSSIPLDRKWAELTPAQQQQIKDYYESINAGDEPPFPVNGLAPLHRTLVKLIAALSQRAFIDTVVDMELEVAVDPQGRVRSVEVFRSPHAELTKLFASALTFERFKPARCGGVPCAMSFPFVIRREYVVN